MLIGTATSVATAHTITGLLRHDRRPAPGPGNSQRAAGTEPAADRNVYAPPEEYGLPPRMNCSTLVAAAAIAAGRNGRADSLRQHETRPAAHPGVRATPVYSTWAGQ